MKESSIKGPFQPAESGVIGEGSIVGTPSAKRAVRTSPSVESVPLDQPPTPTAVTSVPAAGEMLSPMEEYQRLHTLHLESPSPFPIVPLRTSMFDKLKATHDSIGGYKKFEHYNRIKRICAGKKEPEVGDYWKVGEQLYRQYIRDHTIQDATYNFILLTGIMSSIASEERAKLERMRLLIMAFVDTFIVHHDITLEDYRKIEKTAGTVEMSELPQDITNMFLAELENYVEIRNFAAELKERFADKEEELRTIQPELKDMNDGFAEGIRTLRKYGLRSSFYEDGFLHDEGEAWVVTDMNDILEDSGHQSRKGVFATITLSQRSELERVSASDFTRKERSVGSAYVAPYAGRCSFMLKWDGELHDMNAMRHLFVREIFQRVGAEHVYELTRGAFLAQVHDMVVPVRHANAAPSYDRLRSLLTTRTTPGEAGEEGQLGPELRKILLPRKLNMLNPSVAQELQGEEDRRRRRSPRQHDVKDSVRPLAKGRHPTPRAIELARKYGYTLDPNGEETFYKPHSRGSGGTGFIYEQREQS